MSHRILPAAAAAAHLLEAANECAIVPNPSYVFPPETILQLAPRLTAPAERIRAVVMDMDGTTTTTEELCLHSLEHMVRCITDRRSPADWAGLDAERDYPHVIGNSTTRHVEYLLTAYAGQVAPAAFAAAFLAATRWTLEANLDAGRCTDAQTALNHLRTADGADLSTFEKRVRAAIEIYYARYHELLSELAAAAQAGPAAASAAPARGHAIRPMPGVAVFLALIKGWLADAAPAFQTMLEADLAASGARVPARPAAQARLSRLARHFRQHPVKVGVVTSSIRFEADAVLHEVFAAIRDEIAQWPDAREVARHFQRPADYYDAMISASDSSEIRLKPHRDLYSIALHRLGVPATHFDEVVGFEDSESGTLAIRAAGIGRCIGVPFKETSHHDLSAAAHVLHGGLPEAILCDTVFLKESN
jgi:beta-phosphoglucomutase-like phosphatase (HAD superfamily)